MAHIQYVDDLVKEYLLFRGFSQTLRTLENDLKIDKDKGFRVDRLTDQIVSHIQTYDLQGLRDLWAHLDRRLFMRLSPSQQPYVRKLETSILRLYVVNTIQTNKHDKLLDFFDKMALELQTQPEWRDWFVLPYLKGAEDNPAFALYFSRQWQDTLLVSLTNFLAIIFQNLTLPTLARHEEESRYCTKLQGDVEQLSMRLSAALAGPGGGGGEVFSGPPSEPPHPDHLMDDFYNIAQESAETEVQLRSFKSLFGFGNQQQQQQQVERGRTHTPTQLETRRPSSQAPPSDRRRGRSSSLAANSSRSEDREHQPVKRVPTTPQQAQGGSTRRSRSPTRPAATAAQHQPYVVQQQTCVSGEQANLVTCAVFNGSGSTLAYGDMAGTVKLYNTAQTSSSGGWSVRGPVSGLAWLDDRLLLTATNPGLLQLRDTKDNRALWEVGQDNTAHLKDRRLLCVCVTRSSAAAVASVAPRSRTSNVAPSVLQLDTKTAQIETVHQLPGQCSANGCDVNHNGCLVVCGCSDGCVRILDLRTPDVIATWSAHKGQVFGATLSHHQDKLYTIGSDNKLCCWSLAQTGHQLLEYSLHRQAAGPFMIDGPQSTSKPMLLRPYGALFALHDDGQHVFTCSPTGSKLYQINGSDVSCVQQFGGHQQQVLTVDWVAKAAGGGGGGGMCATAALDGSVNVTSLVPSV